MERSDGVLVPVTGLSALIAYPHEIYDRYVLCRRPIPLPPMIAGDLEHEARKLLVERLWQIYLGAREASELRLAYEAIGPAIDEASLRCERRYPGLFGESRVLTANLTNRMRIEEDARIVAAESLLMEGITGIDLIRRLLPQKVEASFQSHVLGLEGRVDAISELDGRAYPIEYKTGGNSDPVQSRAHEIQVAAYCMLIEEETESPCNYGEIYYTRYLTRKPVLVTKATRRAVHDLRRRFLEICRGSLSDASAKLEVAHV